MDKGDNLRVASNKNYTDGVQSDKVRNVVTSFQEGLNCAQAVLSTYGPQFGLEHKNAVKVGGAFGAGMGMGETCGAVTGALMVIGLKHTNEKGPGLFAKEQTQAIALEFMERFKERNGTTACKELLGCDVSTLEGFKMAKQEGHFQKRCPKFVQDAAKILEEILKD